MNTTLIRVVIVAMLSLMGGYLQQASADVPDGINYQGYLTNIDGTPVDTSISITFAAYNVDLGGVPLWSQTDLVLVDKGLFSVTLGDPVNPFPAGLFDGPVYIGLFVAGEEMLPRRELSSAPYAFKAGDSDTVGGVQASALDQSLHVVDTTNPHNVTAAQTGAISSGDLSTHTADAGAHHTRYGDGEAVSAILSADGAGSGLDADLLDGLNADTFDWGRPGVTGTLFEGGNSLSNLYVNEGQVGSVTGGMILDGTISASDLAFSINFTGADLNGGLLSLNNSAAASSGNYPMGLLGEASGTAGAFNTFGVAGLSPGLGTGAPIQNLPVGNQYGVAGVVNSGIGTAGVSTGGSGIGVYGDGSAIGVKGIGPNGPTKGFLGVQGATDFDGEAPLDIVGLEIGVLGYSEGTSTNDNYAFYGVSNGTGIYAEGDTLAGEFVGDIATDRVTYNAPRTHYYSVGDGDFHPASNAAFSTSSGNGGTYLSETGTHVLVAGLHLPDGATITEFRVIVDDNAAGDLSVRISRLAHTGSGFVTLANILSTGTPGITTYIDNTVSLAVVDNQTFNYHVRVFGSNWPGNSTLKIKGAVVVYTITEAD